MLEDEAIGKSKVDAWQESTSATCLQLSKSWAEGRVSKSVCLVGRVVSPIRAGDINTAWKGKEQPWNKVKVLAASPVGKTGRKSDINTCASTLKSRSMV